MGGEEALQVAKTDEEGLREGWEASILDQGQGIRSLGDVWVLQVQQQGSL